MGKKIRHGRASIEIKVTKYKEILKIFERKTGVNDAPHFTPCRYGSKSGLVVRNMGMDVSLYDTLYIRNI